MAYDKQKLSRFQDTVFSEADEKIDAMKTEADEYEKTELDKAKQLEYDKIFTYMQEKVHDLQWENRREVTKKNLEAKRKTLEFRNSLVNNVFEECENKLKEFVLSDKYEDYLIKKIKDATEKFNCNDSVVSVSKQDMKFEKQILSIEKIKSVVEDRSNLLGGFKLINNETGLLLDETIASQLEKQRTYFYKNSGLTVAE